MKKPKIDVHVLHISPSCLQHILSKYAKYGTYLSRLRHLLDK